MHTATKKTKAHHHQQQQRFAKQKKGTNAIQLEVIPKTSWCNSIVIPGATICVLLFFHFCSSHSIRPFYPWRSHRKTTDGARRVRTPHEYSNACLYVNFKLQAMPSFFFLASFLCVHLCIVLVLLYKIFVGFDFAPYFSTIFFVFCS